MELELTSAPFDSTFFAAIVGSRTDNGGGATFTDSVMCCNFDITRVISLEGTDPTEVQLTGGPFGFDDGVCETLS